jgi:hypothetical protein
MADHRDGPRVVNRLFALYQSLPPSQQAVLTQLLTLPPPDDALGFSSPELAEEVAEARQNWLTKLRAASTSPPSL